MLHLAEQPVLTDMVERHHWRRKMKELKRLKMPIIVLLSVVAIGLSAYAMTRIESFGPPAAVNPMTLEIEDSGAREVSDDTVRAETKPHLSKEARDLLEDKLKEAQSMAKSRKRWIQEAETEIERYKEVVKALPEDSKLCRYFQTELESKESWLEGLRERLENSEEEIKAAKKALGGE